MSPVFPFMNISPFSITYFPVNDMHGMLYSQLAKFNITPPSQHLPFNQQRSPAFKSVSLCFVLERHGFWLIKVQALTWIYLKQITGRDRFLMLLSKLDQRSDAAFVHIRTESGEMWRGGDERRTVLFVGWYLEKQRPASLFTPLILPLCLSAIIFVSSFVSASISGRPALCGIHHLPVPVSYQAWTDLSMTQLPLPLPTVSLNCTLIKLGLLIMRA